MVSEPATEPGLARSTVTTPRSSHRSQKGAATHSQTSVRDICPRLRQTTSVGIAPEDICDGASVRCVAPTCCYAAPSIALSLGTNCPTPLGSRSGFISRSPSLGLSIELSNYIYRYLLISLPLCEASARFERSHAAQMKQTRYSAALVCHTSPTPPRPETLATDMQRSERGARSSAHSMRSDCEFLIVARPNHTCTPRWGRRSPSRSDLMNCGGPQLGDAPTPN